MPMYDAYSVYSDPILTNFSLGYDQPAFQGMNLFPLTTVSLPSGRYRVFDRSSWLIWQDWREPGTVANEIRGAKWSEDTFQVHEHSLQAAVTDEERQNVAAANANPDANLRAGISPERDATELVTDAILRRHEKLCADTARNTATYNASNTVTKSGTGQWNDAASDPMADLLTGMREIYKDVLRWPNFMLLPWDVFITLEHHPKLQARYGTAGQLEPGPEAAIRQLTGFQGRIVIADSVYNAADNIDAAESITSLWGKDVILAVTDNAPGQNTRTFAKTFSQPYPAGGVRVVDRWREEPRKSDLVRCSMRYDLKIVSPDAGYLIKNAVA